MEKQAPFITLFMYLDEVEEGQLRDDLALVIEEVLIQRILGVKNEKGVYITPAFPKLIYALDEDNIHEDSIYWYLTVLAAKCTAKRMVPDYISVKKEREFKQGDVYPCMGCVQGDEEVLLKYQGVFKRISFKDFWSFASISFDVLPQSEDKDNPNVYADLKEVEIYDTAVRDFVPCYRIIRNVVTATWKKVTFKTGQEVIVTPDHPFEIEKKGVILAENLSVGDEIKVNSVSYSRINDYDDLKLLELYNTKGVVYTTEVTSVEDIELEDQYSYDVTTESEHFEFSGIYSHNCRSFLTPDRSYKKGNIAKAKNFKEGHPKYYGRLTA